MLPSLQLRREEQPDVRSQRDLIFKTFTKQEPSEPAPAKTPAPSAVPIPEKSVAATQKPLPLQQRKSSRKPQAGRISESKSKPAPEQKFRKEKETTTKRKEDQSSANESSKRLVASDKQLQEASGRKRQEQERPPKKVDQEPEEEERITSEQKSEAESYSESEPEEVSDKMKSLSSLTDIQTTASEKKSEQQYSSPLSSILIPDIPEDDEGEDEDDKEKSSRKRKARGRKKTQTGELPAKEKKSSTLSRLFSFKKKDSKKERMVHSSIGARNPAAHMSEGPPPPTPAAPARASAAVQQVDDDDSSDEEDVDKYAAYMDFSQSLSWDAPPPGATSTAPPPPPPPATAAGAPPPPPVAAAGAPPPPVAAAATAPVLFKGRAPKPQKSKMKLKKKEKSMEMGSYATDNLELEIQQQSSFPNTDLAKKKKKKKIISKPVRPISKSSTVEVEGGEYSYAADDSVFGSIGIEEETELNLKSSGSGQYSSALENILSMAASGYGYESDSGGHEEKTTSEVSIELETSDRAESGYFLARSEYCDVADEAKEEEYYCTYGTDNLSEMYATEDYEGHRIDRILGEDDYGCPSDYSTDDSELYETPVGKRYFIQSDSELESASEASEAFSRPSAIPKGSNVWNDLFQDAFDRFNTMDEQTPIAERLGIYKTLSSLARNFSYTAELYGKIIIAEKQFSNEMKSIKPCKLNGIIGGLKYIVHGILFKFAVDSSGMLKDDETAMKIANHELKSLDNLLNCHVPGLHYPLLAIVDYRGYRLIAMSTLPLNNYTLMFGSSDAARTVHNKIPELAELTSEACRKLNLKPHKAGNAKNPVIVPGPVDLECHKGTDKRYYIIDFSRLFPPDLLSRIHCSQLFRLLRPELVKSYHKPLCSDTFSKFVAPFREEAVEHMEEIKEAHLYMKTQIIPAFSQMLSSQPARLFQATHLIHSMHREGINIRYMGLVRGGLDPVKDIEWSDLILVEILARTIKWDIRRVLRKTTESSDLKIPSSFNHKENVVKYLNTVFGNTSASVDYWKDEIIRSLAIRFPSALRDEEAHDIPKLRKYVIQTLPGDLFVRISKIAGIEFTESAISQFSKDSAKFFESERPFDVIHLAEFTSTVKQLSVVEQSNALLLQLRGKLSKDQHYGIQLLQRSLAGFEKALECNPSDKLSLLQCARLSVKLNSPRAATYFSFAIQMAGTDPTINFSYARYLHATREGKSKRDAEQYYLTAIRECPTHFPAIFNYACLLHELNDSLDTDLIKMLAKKLCTEGPPQIVNKLKKHAIYSLVE